MDKETMQTMLRARIRELVMNELDSTVKIRVAHAVKRHLEHNDQPHRKLDVILEQEIRNMLTQLFPPPKEKEGKDEQD